MANTINNNNDKGATFTPLNDDWETSKAYENWKQHANLSLYLLIPSVILSTIFCLAFWADEALSLVIELTVTFMVILQALSMMMMKKVANSCPSNKYDVNPTTSSILLFLYPFASFIFTVLSTLPLLIWATAVTLYPPERDANDESNLGMALIYLFFLICIAIASPMVASAACDVLCMSHYRQWSRIRSASEIESARSGENPEADL